VAWLEGHLEAAAEAIARGIDLRAFHVWSLLDNFEWAEGYAHRFGIVHVDFATMERTPKASYDWYRELIARHGA
jgi:beta-glucosidase